MKSCDDGNTYGGDGCGADCRAEPVCTGTNGCTSPCGDGLKLPSEACDDGNVVSGDGCSADLHAGAQLGLPRRQRRRRRQPGRARRLPRLHAPATCRAAILTSAPDVSGTIVTGMVQATLAADRKPVMAGPPPQNGSLTTAADFAEWYHDSPRNKAVRDTMTLTRAGERHVRLRPFGEVERHGAGRMDHAAVLPGRRSRMGRAAEWPGDQLPRRLRQRPA